MCNHSKLSHFQVVFVWLSISLRCSAWWWEEESNRRIAIFIVICLAVRTDRFGRRQSALATSFFKTFQMCIWLKIACNYTWPKRADFRMLNVDFVCKCFRWLLWINKKADDCWRLGMGMVACNRCAASIARGDDIESNVRGRRDRTRCTINCNRSCTMQNHEGMSIRFVSTKMRRVSASSCCLTLWMQELY